MTAVRTAPNCKNAYRLRDSRDPASLCPNLKMPLQSFVLPSSFPAEFPVPQNKIVPFLSILLSAAALSIYPDVK
eukprot:2016378-Rhodomonas_salina.1